MTTSCHINDSPYVRAWNARLAEVGLLDPRDRDPMHWDGLERFR